MLLNFLHTKNKKIGKHITLFLRIGVLTLSINTNISQSYYFGLKSADNTPENILNIENTLNIKLPILSFIFDPREENDVLNTIDRIVDTLGTDRIYHFTISPNNLSANDVALGLFDDQYTAFFQKIKETNLHVIFRTMHEMNGGRYPRSSNPENFKSAWIHVRNLSRAVGLNEENIAFDFSVNHRDMPTKGIPSQLALLTQCTQNKTGCYHFEDYYPGHEFVDVVGFTFYNRGKAIGNRQWLTPTQILYDKDRNTYTRIQSFNKPIIIDEVATTSVRYNGNYNFAKSRNEYLNHNERKDLRLHQLREFLINHPEINAILYFNTDYTQGLSFKIIGEADWAIVNLQENKIYGGFQDLEMFGEKNLDNILSSIFHIKKVEIEGNKLFIPENCSNDFIAISSIISEKTDTTEEKIDIIQALQKPNIKSNCIIQSLNILSELYNKILAESTNQ